jgi:hypothetical protein
MDKIRVAYLKNDAGLRDLAWDLRIASRSDGDLPPLIEKVKALDGYLDVAEVEVDERKDLHTCLEYVWSIMQNGIITDSWTLSPPDGLTPLVEPYKIDGRDYGHRSSDVGDLYTYQGKTYMVGSIGFIEAK